MVEEVMGGAAGENGLDGEELANLADGDELLVERSGQVDEERSQECSRIVSNCKRDVSEGSQQLGCRNN